MPQKQEFGDHQVGIEIHSSDMLQSDSDLPLIESKRRSFTDNSLSVRRDCVKITSLRSIKDGSK